jgi:DNA adenine methylase
VYVKPLLKWAGGKSRIAVDIERAFGERCSGTYYEPFVGSAAVYLYRRDRMLCGRAVLSDVNAKLVETHRAIRDDPDAVIQAIAALPQVNWKEQYYSVREAYNHGPWVGPEHAARFIWLNRAGFNGLYRENRHGQFNVPAGSYSRLTIPEPSAFWEVSRMLQGVELMVGGFAAVMERAGPNDHVYCDPPYVPLSETACFTAYSKEPFDLQEQAELARLARLAAARGARVVLSNHDVPVVRDELYAERHGFSLHGQQVHRAISRNGADRKAVPEVIAAIGPLAMASV